MKKTAIIFGGKSVEHEVSILTAAQCAKVTKEVLNPIFIYITKDNKFLLLKTFPRLADFVKGVKGRPITFVKGGIKSGLVETLIDCIINCCHGGIGENGNVAALCNIFSIPITSAEALAASTTMNKAVTKKLLGSKVPVVESVVCRVLQDADLVGDWEYPLIVKPCSLGSSIGVVKCDNADALKLAIQTGLMLDDSVMIEKCISPLRELNCAAYRSGQNIVLSEVEEPFSNSNILSFADKYQHSANKGMKGLDRRIPADVPREVYDEVVNLTQLIYIVLELKGVVRVDYLFDGEKVFFNEVNTVPGSLSGYLFEPSGKLYIEMILDMIREAKTIFESRDRLIFNFDSDLLLR